jgi:hypothetical protein
MRAKLLVLLTLCITATLFTACVKTVDGRRTAAVPFTRDRVQSLYNRPAREVVAAVRDVLAHNGVITSEDTVRLTFEANVDQRRVWVRVEEQEAKVTQLTIQCRGKGGGADLDLAIFLDRQVAVRLASGTLGTLPAAKPSAPSR